MLANSGCLPTVPPRSQTISSWGAFNSPYSPISGVFRSHVGQFNPAWLSDIK